MDRISTQPPPATATGLALLLFFILFIIMNILCEIFLVFGKHSVTNFCDFVFGLQTQWLKLLLCRRLPLLQVLHCLYYIIYLDYYYEYSM